MPGGGINLCVWVKDNGGMGSFYRSQHELVLVFRKGRGSHRNNVQLGQFGRYRTNVWEYPGIHTLSKQGDEGNLLTLHPTVKPVSANRSAVPNYRLLDKFKSSTALRSAREKAESKGD